MQKFKMILLLVCLMLSFQVFGEVYNGVTNLTLRAFDTLTINGPAYLRLIKAKTLEINGPLEFRSLDVADKAILRGAVKGEKGKFGQLDVTGTLDIDHVICGEMHVLGAVKAIYLEVKAQALIEGALDAEHCHFKDVTIKSDQILFNDVTVDNVFVKGNQPHQLLILKGATVVEGDITFDSGSGIVQVDDPEVKIQGKIKNGTLKK
jgi:hypothetical protein